MTYEKIRADEAIKTYITAADDSLRALGYTEHSFPHVCRVAEELGYVGWCQERSSANKDYLPNFDLTVLGTPIKEGKHE